MVFDRFLIGFFLYILGVRLLEWLLNILKANIRVLKKHKFFVAKGVFPTRVYPVRNGDEFCDALERNECDEVIES